MNTPKSELIALAERCEAASGADRILDADISMLIGMTPREKRSYAGWNAMRPRGKAPRLERDWLIKNGRRWSASLDAAMTLVPEGWCKTVADWWMEGDDRAPFFADCGNLAELKAGNEGMIQQAWAQSPALALCAAALQARARSEAL